MVIESFLKKTKRLKLIESFILSGYPHNKECEIFGNYVLPHFNNVYLFSMNDEVVHTGFDQMSHYIFAIATNKK